MSAEVKAAAAESKAAVEQRAVLKMTDEEFLAY